MRLVSEVIERISEESEVSSSALSWALRDSMAAILDDLMASGECLGASVSSIDGIAWAERLQPGFDKHRFAAMSSSLLAISDELASEQRCGPTRNMLIEGEAGKIVIMHAGPMLLLTVFSRETVTLGMVMAHARQAADKLAAMRI